MPTRDDDEIDEASRESFPASDPPAFTVTTGSRVPAAHAYAAHAALDPFFDVVQRGLAGLVDGAHFFDTIAERAVFEFRYEIGSWPKRVEGRDALIALYRGYGDRIVLERGDELVVHRGDDGKVVVLEYEVHGRVVGTGAPYDNRFVSIVTIENRKIVHWRDYMDSLAAMRALSSQ